MSIYQPNVSNPRTDAQEGMRQRFGLLSDLMSKCLAAVNLGYGPKKGNGKTACNLFMAQVQHVFTGAYPSQVIDNSKLMFSSGKVDLPINPSVSVSGANLVMGWTDNTAQGGYAAADDVVAAVFYNPQKGQCVTVASAAKREDATYSFAYPTSWAGDNCEVYFFMRTADGKENSDSLYLGSMSL